MLSLPDVTLVAIDTTAYALTRMALEDTLRRIEPADVLIWSDTIQLATSSEAIIKPLAAAADWDKLVWYDVPRKVQTSHFLTVQWDGWVTDAAAWNPEFLEYDYIGAPWWWYPDDHKVGNGGFALYSTRLAHFLIEHRDRFPCVYPADHNLCRCFRPALEAEGFRWAPVDLAAHFSFEHAHPSFPTFGFHDFRNWPWVLSDEEIDERLDAASAYVVKKTDLIQQMLENQKHVRNK